jgi:hypothetical protein
VALPEKVSGDGASRRLLDRFGRKAWSNFLGSDTGAKLRHLRWNRVYEAQQRAVTDRKDPAYSAGIAFGILGMTSEETLSYKSTCRNRNSQNRGILEDLIR